MHLVDVVVGTGLQSSKEKHFPAFRSSVYCFVVFSNQIQYGAKKIDNCVNIIEGEGDLWLILLNKSWMTRSEHELYCIVSINEMAQIT